MKQTLCSLEEPITKITFLDEFSSAAGENFLCPAGIDASEEMVLVADSCNHRVVALRRDKDYFQPFINRTDVDPPLYYPTDIAVDPSGTIWITDRWNHLVRGFTPDGAHITDIGGCGTRPLEFMEPWGIACAGQELYVADRGNHRVQVIGLRGEYINSFGQSGFSKQYYEGAGFKKGFVYEWWMGGVNRFNTLETRFHQQGYSIGTLDYPEGVALTSEGLIVVADKSNDRVQIFNKDGSTQATITPNTFEKHNFSRPRHATVGPGGEIMLAFEIDHRLMIIKGDNCSEVSFSEYTPRVTAAFISGNRLWIVNGRDHKLLLFGINSKD